MLCRTLFPTGKRVLCLLLSDGQRTSPPPLSASRAGTGQAVRGGAVTAVPRAEAEDESHLGPSGMRRNNALKTRHGSRGAGRAEENG